MPNSDYTTELLNLEEVIVKKCKFLLAKSAFFWSSPARWTLTDCVHDYRMQERPLSNTIYNAGYDVDRVNLAAWSVHLTKAA
jgi:hypothetical protein